MLRLARTPSAPRRFIYTDSWSEHTLHEWLTSRRKPQQLRDGVSIYRLKRLFEFLPTRNHNDFGTLKKLSSDTPQEGEPIPLGHHLVLLPDNHNHTQTLLRPDGSVSWHAPPSPWTRRQWSSGKIWFSAKSRLLVGLKFVQKRVYLDKKWAQTNPDLSKEPEGPTIPSVFVKQDLVVLQWHPHKTELLSEERVTEYHTGPYDPLQIKTSSLIPPQSGALSFAFLPTPFLLYSFSSLYCETHRIHFDLEYARQEGYPDLVVHVQLQLILILETLAANLPEGISIRGLEYTVINPLFAGCEIKIYMHWLHGPDKHDSPLRLLSQVPSGPSPPAEDLEPQSESKTAEVQAPARARTRNPQRQERHEKRKRVALLWTEAGNGVVGIVAKVTLQQRPKNETVDDLSWTMNKKQGYLVRRGEPQQANTEGNNPAPDTLRRDTSAGTGRSASQPAPTLLSCRLQDTVKFDPSGKPITESLPRSTVAKINRTWPPGIDDAATMEEERLQRKKKAEANARSQKLFERLFGRVE